MPRLVWVNPANFKQQYVTALISDPNVPAGYILTAGSDGAQDQPLQTVRAGINSGGFPGYTEDPSQRTDWPNGIFTSKPGGAVGGG